MCEPTTIAYIGLALAGATGVASYQQNSVNAKVQTRQHEQNQRNANAAVRDAYIALQNRQQQEAESAAAQIEERRRESTRQMSSAYAAASEAGVSGFSVQSVLRDIGAIAAREVSNIEESRDWSINQLSSEMAGARNQSMGQMNATAPGIKPSGWATALQIGASATDTYTGYMRQTGTNPLGEYFGKSTTTKKT